MRTLPALLFLLLSLVAARADDARLTKIEPLTVVTGLGASLFTVEVADTADLRERGLMFRQAVPEGRGMLFDFKLARPVGMWMKDTYVSLDMVFIRPDGTVARIAENTVPRSLEVIAAREPILGVLEFAAGTAQKIGLKAGDRVYHRIFATQD
jgi:hypothetical protein